MTVDPTTRPTSDLERAAGAFDGALVIGVDEVGRGPWAGPVVAAAAILDLRALPTDAAGLVADSKALSAARRAEPRWRRSRRTPAPRWDAPRSPRSTP